MASKKFIHNKKTDSIVYDVLSGIDAVFDQAKRIVVTNVTA